jgi:hypothetical protein
VIFCQNAICRPVHPCQSETRHHCWKRQQIIIQILEISTWSIVKRNYLQKVLTTIIELRSTHVAVLLASCDARYYPPTLASGNITHPCNSRYLGKIFLYIEHNHMEYIYIINSRKLKPQNNWFRVRVMVFNATFNNISVRWRRSVLLVEETGVPGEKHQFCIASPFSDNVKLVLKLDLDPPPHSDMSSLLSDISESEDSRFNFN